MNDRNNPLLNDFLKWFTEVKQVLGVIIQPDNHQWIVIRKLKNGEMLARSAVTGKLQYFYPDN